eukprot:scaffold11026_cov148-Amphora_coffeaeformis.AAC.1
MSLHNARLNQYVKTEERLVIEIAQVYALIWGRCTSALQHKVKAFPTFESTIKGQPVELLKAIEQLSIAYTANRYPYASARDAHYNLLTCRQKDEESLVDYYNRFKSARDIMLNQVGPLTVVALAQKEPGYTQGTTDDDEITLNSEGSTVAPVVPRTVEECNKAAHDKYLAYLFLIGAHSLKYGSLIKTLAQSFSLGTNQYPATLAEAFAVLE